MSKDKKRETLAIFAGLPKEIKKAIIAGKLLAETESARESQTGTQSA